jgi:hypothetical protein
MGTNPSSVWSDVNLIECRLGWTIVRIDLIPGRSARKDQVEDHRLPDLEGSFTFVRLETNCGVAPR